MSCRPWRRGCSRARRASADDEEPERPDRNLIVCEVPVGPWRSVLGLTGTAGAVPNLGRRRHAQGGPRRHRASAENRTEGDGLSTVYTGNNEARRKWDPKTRNNGLVPRREGKPRAAACDGHREGAAR